MEWKARLLYYEELTKSSEPPLNYISIVELWKLMSKGVLLNGGKTWFSLNKKGEHCEMTSITECLDSHTFEIKSYDPSRFGVIAHFSKNEIFKAHVKTQFLSPGVTYTVNLVFELTTIVNLTDCHPISLKYKLQGETETLNPYLSYMREDGWYMAELYQFTSDERVVDLEILFDVFDDIYVDGIEFWPLEKSVMKHKDENQPISDSDANWKENLPADYEDIMKWSIDSVQWTTKKEAYSIIRNGFLIDDGQKWFSIDKNGKKCHMLSATDVCIDENIYTMPCPESRFGEAIGCHSGGFIIRSKIKSQLVSSQTTYASYLVYKLPKNQSGFEAPLFVNDEDWGTYIYLASPQTPVIRPKDEQNTYNPLDKQMKGFPLQRSDGWMEVQIWEFRTAATTTEMSHIRLALITRNINNLRGLIIQGIEIRPI
ncbi:hypothetical protein E3N88_08481 [Mikania micrantha]|uniref:Uncharacterized protein n=1 Tax=Mikania micrantha TaxID=192012 RepID=A0A5N6PJF3_9ASTR|nr:hypothetical protein E3N88_08481 [Mikania micrantha]